MAPPPAQSLSSKDDALAPIFQAHSCESAAAYSEVLDVPRAEVFVPFFPRTQTWRAELRLSRRLPPARHDPAERPLEEPQLSPQVRETRPHFSPVESTVRRAEVSRGYGLSSATRIFGTRTWVGKRLLEGDTVARCVFRIRLPGLLEHFLSFYFHRSTSLEKHPSHSTRDNLPSCRIGYWILDLHCLAGLSQNCILSCRVPSRLWGLQTFRASGFLSDFYTSLLCSSGLEEKRPRTQHTSSRGAGTLSSTGPHTLHRAH